MHPIHRHQVQTIGIIGGMSWYSTINYYRIINAQVQEALGGHHSARVLIDSLDFDEVRALQLAEDWDDAGALLAASGRRLQDAGAQRDYEHLRTVYERMLERGPERFQVKPSGLPDMAALYQQLPVSAANYYRNAFLYSFFKCIFVAIF